MVEQVALFEAGHTVNAETLAQYLPSGSAEYTPARPGGEHSYEREREMLFNMIFNLRNRIDELTARLDETPLTDAVEVSQPSQPASAPMPHLPAPLLRDLKPLEPTAQPDERAAIVEALRRADGRRKAAAEALGISERTLYRKIREYGIE